MDWDNNCYFLLTSEAIASVLEIPREASPSAFLSSSIFWERFVIPPSASAPAYVYYIRLDSFSLIHVNISPPGANLSQMVLKHFRTIHCISWKGRSLMCLLTENVGRGWGSIGECGLWRTLIWEWFTQGHYSLFPCDLGQAHWPLHLSFLTCTMGIIVGKAWGGCDELGDLCAASSTISGRSDS